MFLAPKCFQAMEFNFASRSYSLPSGLKAAGTRMSSETFRCAIFLVVADHDIKQIKCCSLPLLFALQFSVEDELLVNRVRGVTASGMSHEGSIDAFVWRQPDSAEASVCARNRLPPDCRFGKHSCKGHSSAASGSSRRFSSPKCSRTSASSMDTGRTAKSTSANSLAVSLRLKPRCKLR